LHSERRRWLLSRPEPPYDAPRILAVLQRQVVRFVAIGGVAAILQGSPQITEDFDITPDAAPDNLEALVGALAELDAKLRTPQGPVEFPIDRKMLSGASAWTFSTSAGAFDLVFEPAGTRGYDDLRRSAVELDVGLEQRVLVASLVDLIRMKEAAGRAKDQAALPALRQTLEVIREREREGR
jgi:hypothetical protein